MQVPNGNATAGESAVAQRALQEVGRLVEEATERLEGSSFIEAMSSLTAIPNILDPLIGYLSRTWVTDATGAGDAVAALPGGTYL